MGPTRRIPVALSYMGSKGDSKLGPAANNGKIKPVGVKVWGCCLGIFDLAGGNGPREYVGKGVFLCPIRCTPVALGYKNGTPSWVPRLNVCKVWVRKFGDAASESSTLWDATGPVSI